MIDVGMYAEKISDTLGIFMFLFAGIAGLALWAFWRAVAHAGCPHRPDPTTGTCRLCGKRNVG